MPKWENYLRERAGVTHAVLESLPRIPDISPEEVQAHAALITLEHQKSVECAAAQSEVSVHAATAEEGWRALHQALKSWYAVAKVTAPDSARAALATVRTGGSYSPGRTRTRAEQVLAALTQFPEGFAAAGVTRISLQAALDAQLARVAALGEARATASTLTAQLRELQTRLDKDNKRLYAILAAVFCQDGTAEYGLVRTIPTLPPTRKKREAEEEGEETTEGEAEETTST